MCIKVCQTYLCGFLQEGVRKIIHELVGVVDTVCELADDPDDRSLGLGLVEQIQVLAQLGDDALVLSWVSSEDVLDDNHRFLDNIRHLRLNKIQQRLYAGVRRLLNLDCKAADGPYSFADEVDIYLRCIS